MISRRTSFLELYQYDDISTALVVDPQLGFTSHKTGPRLVSWGVIKNLGPRFRAPSTRESMYLKQALEEYKKSQVSF